MNRELVMVPNHRYLIDDRLNFIHVLARTKTEVNAVNNASDIRKECQEP